MFSSIISGLITAAISAAVGYAAARFLTKYRFRHIRHLASKDRRHVRIVVPALLRGTFPSGHVSERAQIPENIPLMPMAEGRALAYLVFAIRESLRNVAIECVAPQDFVDDGTPFVSLGGPSVNGVSSELLSLRAPKFRIDYPEHVAHYGSVAMSPVLRDNKLEEDFGFLLQSTTRQGTPCVVACGVWATGSELACLAYADRLPNESSARIRKHLLKARHVLVILRASVDNYQLVGPELVSIQDVSLHG